MTESLKSVLSETVYTRLTASIASKKAETEALLESLRPSVEEMKTNIIKDFGSEEKFLQEMGAKENTKSKFIAVPKKTIDDSIQYAWTLYEMGDYENARTLINTLFCIADHTQDLLKLTWGRLYLNLIARFHSNDAGQAAGQSLVEELKSLRHRVEVRGPESYFQVISGRCSLLHYFLIVTYSFGVEPDYDYLIELFSNDNYMSAIQTCAPHLFRYLIFMLILSKNKKKTAKYNLDNVTTTYENNLCQYEDAVVRFVKLLFLEFNFEKANEAIKQFKQEISKDIFLSDHTDLAVNNSKEMLFEVFCNIYSSVDIDLISKYLELSKEESEIWIVNLIRKNNIKARFSTDNKSNLELKSKHNNAYEEVTFHFH
jgi:translation initiation factor 3 subunit E